MKDMTGASESVSSFFWVYYDYITHLLLGGKKKEKDETKPPFCGYVYIKLIRTLTRTICFSTILSLQEEKKKGE